MKIVIWGGVVLKRVGRRVLRRGVSRGWRIRVLFGAWGWGRGGRGWGLGGGGGVWIKPRDAILRITSDAAEVQLR